VQVRVMENHQNGKDTHVRGLKIYAKDERWGGGGLDLLDDAHGGRARTVRKAPGRGAERTVLLEPDWMGDPELR
jgi:anaphase-promoting complex subunit 10